MNRLALLVPLLAASLAAAGPPRITAARIVQALIRDLGADSYAAREHATATLRLIGQPARQALEKAAQSDDPEVRLRARDILRDVRLGIGPQWPADIVLLVRHFDQLQQHERSNAIYRIARLGPKAVPFLVRRMEVGTTNEANWAVNALQQRGSNPEVCREVIRLITKPKNEQQARALAWARTRRGDALGDIDALADRLPPAQLKLDKPTETAIANILAQLNAGKPNQALAAAKALATSHPADPRALYLQAQALVALNKDKQALALRDKALGLAPDQQQPHHLAAALLMKLGLNRQAVKELQKVTEIPPNDGPLDTNAYLRLSAIHATSGLFEPAAQYLEKALKLLLKAKDQEQLKPLATVLQAEVDRLRQRAASFPVAPDAVVEDAVPHTELKLQITIVPKQGKLDDLQRALAATAAQFQIAADLPDIETLALPAASVKYDGQKHQLLVLLHDTPACDPLPFQAKANDARVALHLPGFTYIYKIDPATGAAERLARFEKDYLVALKPGLRLSALARPTLRINGQSYKWQKALDGIPFDRLPERFDIVVEGTAPLGRRITIRASLPAGEPSPASPEPPSAARPNT